MHRSPINEKTRPKIAQAINMEMEQEITPMRHLLEKGNIVQLYGVAFKELNPVMIIESWVDDLQSYLQNMVEQNTPVDYAMKLRYCIDVLQGIQSLHNVNIVHGDLKASSIV